MFVSHSIRNLDVFKGRFDRQDGSMLQGTVFWDRREKPTEQQRLNGSVVFRTRTHQNRSVWVSLSSHPTKGYHTFKKRRTQIIMLTQIQSAALLGLSVTHCYTLRPLSSVTKPGGDLRPFQPRSLRLPLCTSAQRIPCCSASHSFWLFAFGRLGFP